MKPSWFLIILLPFVVAILNLQNAHAVTIHFLQWEITTSAALLVQLTALLGALVGLTVGVWSRRRPPLDHTLESTDSPPSFGA